MTRNGLIIAAVFLILLAIGANSYLSLHDHDRLQANFQVESEQRVHTIGERCETTDHQAKEHGSQEAWFLRSHQRCLKSLAKVEARAGVHYGP